MALNIYHCRFDPAQVDRFLDAENRQRSCRVIVRHADKCNQLDLTKYYSRAVGSVVVRASDSKPEGLVSMPDASKYTRTPCLNCGGGDRWCRHLSSIRRIVAMNWYHEFHGPRSDYVRQVALATATLWQQSGLNSLL
ncbi:hypothetical protein TNCV_521431 [Trichonephila clavipes]|nr:hypothetical protein TNCV_521431 [Trichonephila clavipes]